MELFAKTLLGFQLLTTFPENSALDVRQGSEYVSAMWIKLDDFIPQNAKKCKINEEISNIVEKSINEGAANNSFHSSICFRC